MGHKILIADDETIICDFFKEKFEALGFTVSVAFNGADAVEIAKQDTPDVVLLDIKMPGMDGITALKTMRENDPNIAVIILSAKSQLHEVRKGLEAGARNYLVKPLPPEDIIKAVNDVLSK